MPTNITLKNGAVVTLGFCENEIPEILDVIRDFCSDDFYEYASDKITTLQDEADYNTLKINSDIKYYETELDDYKKALQEIKSILQCYEADLIRGNVKFSRKRIFELFEKIHDEIEEVL